MTKNAPTPSARILQIFARISRLIMRDEFRAELEAASDAEALRAVLADALEPQPVVAALS